METKILCGLVFVLVLLVTGQNCVQGVEYGSDLLGGAGDFEIQGQTGNGAWTPGSGNGSELAAVSNAYAHTGSYSWKLGPATAADKNICAEMLVSTAANRQHKIMAYVKYEGSSPTFARIRLGSDAWADLMNLTWESSYFYTNTKYYTTKASETTPVLCLAMYSNSVNDTIYMDDIAVYRERCRPKPISDSLSGVLPGTGEATTVSIYCDPCSDGTYNYRFDPDITVECSEAIINSVTWVSDQQIDVNLTVTSQDENVELFLKNQYSDLYASYVMEVNDSGRCMPDPNSDSLGGVGFLGGAATVPYNQEVVFTIKGVEANDSTFYFERAFDQDVTVLADQATIHSVTWISANEIEVDLTVTAGDDDILELTVLNPSSNLSEVYKMKIDKYSSVDILDGDGGFEFDGGQGSWTNWSGNGSEPSDVNSTYACSGSYSWKLGPSSASGKNIRVENLTVNTLANRSYRIGAYARYAGSSPSWARIKLGDSPWDTTMNLTSASSYFKGNTLYYTTKADETAPLLCVGLYSNSANDTIYVDDISVKRERCAPKAVSDSNGGVLTYGQQCNISLYCDSNQTVGSLNCKFDPDIEVTSSQATINSHTWVSDTQLDISITTTCGDDNDVVINLENVDSGVTASYILKNKYGADILQSKGDFDDPNSSASIGDRTEWITTADSNMTAGFTSARAQSGTWSWKAESAAASIGATLINRVDITSAANRLHRLECKTYNETSSPASFTVKIGQDSARSLSLSLNDWIANSITYTTGANESSLDLLFEVESDSANDKVYLDDVVLRRERCRPNPQSDSLSGILPYEQATVVSIYGVSGTDGLVKLAFDPDIEVHSDQAVINSVTWVSDTQIDVNIAGFYGGDIELTLENKYSQLSATYTMSSKMPDGHFATSSDEFPIILYDAGISESDMELARTCGFTYLQRFTHSSDANVAVAIDELLNYMDLAQDYGMRLMVYLRLQSWFEDPNCMDRIETIVTAVKDHNAMGFWHLADEPECQGVYMPANEVEPYYTLVKNITPNVPVALTHSQQSVYEPQWWEFYDCEDIFMTDRYWIHDKPFPFGGADSATDWFQNAYNTSHGAHADFVMPSLQLHNRLSFGVGAWPAITANCRNVTQTEARYWSYATIIQGAKGLGWYSYWHAITPILNGAKDYTWLENVFRPLGQETREFVYLTKPIYEPTVILDGTSTDSNLFMAEWLRTANDWLVLVNGDSTDRTVTIDLTGYFTNADLQPWGLSRNVPAGIRSNQLIVHLEPWETIIWTATAIAPGRASSPSPADSGTEVSITSTLSWTAGTDATSHDVYFGTNITNVTDATHASSEYKGNQAGTTYNPGTLAASTTYYWRIDEVGNGGTTTGIVWSFTTNANVVPTFVAAGAVTSNTTAITPALPAGIATNDILLLFLETSNQAISISNQNGGTWTEVTNSPQGTGTAAGTTGARLTAFWSRYNGTQGAPTTSDSGDHQLGRMIAIRGATTSGTPWNLTAGGVEAVSDTSGSIPGATTTATNTLVVTAIATSLPDASSTAKFSAWTNANLASITERTDNSVTAGNGGGLGVATGIRAATGAYGNTAVTLVNAAYKGMMSIAIKP